MSKKVPVVKFSIVVDRSDLNEIGYRRGDELAYMVFDAVDNSADAVWKDPHGGQFTEDEQDMLHRIARGARRSITLHVGTPDVGTPDVVNLQCRLVARYI